MIAVISKYWLGVAVILGLGISSGESKTVSRPSDSKFASVKIEKHTKKEIAAATIAVFEQADYLSVGGVKNELVFESEGKDWMQRAYGSNIGSGPVLERVRAQVVDEGSGVFRLQCNAYVMQPGRGSDDKEIAVRVRRSGPYRDLLKQVARKLSQTP
jgi:hypothetical protein